MCSLDVMEEWRKKETGHTWSLNLVAGGERAIERAVYFLSSLLVLSIAKTSTRRKRTTNERCFFFAYIVYSVLIVCDIVSFYGFFYAIFYSVFIICDILCSNSFFYAKSICSVLIVWNILCFYNFFYTNILYDVLIVCAIYVMTASFMLISFTML